MSAKDRRKALELTVPAPLASALRSYAIANRDRSLAAACRRILRAALVDAPDRRLTSLPKPARKPLRLRIQLEPELRRRPDGAPRSENEVLTLLATHLSVEIDGA